MTEQAAPWATGMPREIAMMVAHHEEQQARLDLDTGALVAAAEAGRDIASERGALRDLLMGEVLPHALAEEEAIYSVGSGITTVATLVSGMLMEHQVLLRLADRVAGAESAVVAAAAATAFDALFDVHVRKENELLLPGLVAAGTDPAELLTAMLRAFDARRAAGAARVSAARMDTTGVQARAGEPVVDTRVHPAGSCASLANAAVDGLAPGGSFVLVADHDPRGIHYMLDAERPGSTTWELLEDGPDRWQARIVGMGAASTEVHAG